MAVTTSRKTGGTLANGVLLIFANMGILPVLLIGAFIFFGTLEPRFLSSFNMFNVARQATYLTVAAMGQMVLLITSGFDLSMGSTTALTSVVAALVMTYFLGIDPNAVPLAIAAGIGAGLLVGVAVGAVNGIGVAVLNVPAFMMTLGMLSAVFGVALIMSGGAPIFGVPEEFKMWFGYGRLFDIPAPMYYTAMLFVVLYFVLNYTRMGRYLYAIGSNRRAAELSGISTRTHLFFAYVICGVMAACAGLLLMARAGTGEPTLGQKLVLEPIAACVIGGVSLFGGVGRLPNVILGAFFMSLLTNGMNLIRIESYAQQIVIGFVLVLAIVVDQLRLRYVASMGR
ncbi:MAG: ribose transport system permease protein [Rhodospirillaceae bacterium]|jgi:ribose/xylose/arabinose/galactoside ABC-type transport system permease subunit|nr:ribose transport system permease protein [Rhodospirillaceae bacterium]